MLIGALASTSGTWYRLSSAETPKVERPPWVRASMAKNASEVRIGRLNRRRRSAPCRCRRVARAWRVALSSSRTSLFASISSATSRPAPPQIISAHCQPNSPARNTTVTGADAKPI